MKVKNISGKDLKFKGGLCKAGDSAEVEYKESKFLFSQGWVTLAKEAPKVAEKPKVANKPKVVKD